MPSGVTVIADNAFAYADIDTVELPATLKTIGEAAFYCSTIKNIVIPKKVESVGDLAFEWCPFLEKITFEGTPEIGSNAVVITDALTADNLIFKTDEGNTKQQILDNGTAEYGTTAFYNMLNTNRKKLGLEEVAIPDDVETTSDAPQNPLSTTVPSDAPQNPLSTTVPSDKEKANENPKTTDKPSDTPKLKTIEVNSSNMLIKIDDKAVAFPDAKPFIDSNDRTQVPVRAVAEMLDSEVKWDGETETVTISNTNGGTVTFKIDSDIMTVNGKNVQMDTAAIIKDERTYIPIRFVAEALGLTVEWYN